MTSRSARGPVILRKLAERAFRLADLRQDASFDDDFRMRGYADPVGPALDHFDRLAEQRAGDLHFVVIERGDRLRRQNAGRVHADHQRDLQRLAGLLGHAEIMPGMARQQQDADAVGAADLAAMNRDVLNAGLRIAGDQQRRRDIGPAVMFVVFRNRQLLQQIDLAVNDVVHRRRGYLDPWQRMANGMLETRQQFAGRQRRAHPRSSCVRQTGLRPPESDARQDPETAPRARVRASLATAASSSISETPSRATASRSDGDEPLQPAAQIRMAWIGRPSPPGVLPSFPPSRLIGQRHLRKPAQEISSRLGGRPRHSDCSPQRLTTPTSISNRSSARPTV